MGREKWKYDKTGEYIPFVLLTFLIVILLPLTIYWWPKKKEKKHETICGCEDCLKKDEQLKPVDKPNLGKNIARTIVIILWCLVAKLISQILEIKHESHFDPYQILGVQEGADKQEIRRAYRKLSVIFHPDKKTGNAEEFVKITKAYNIFSNNKSFLNWINYGNPDGEVSMIADGIALPFQIVEEENSYLILIVYGILFIIVLPTVVHIWWSKSVRYSSKILVITKQLYGSEFVKDDNVHINKLIMILGGSLEFERHHNSKIKERSTSDLTELENIKKQLKGIQENIEHFVFKQFYAVKARTLIHAHLKRIKFQQISNSMDRIYILKKGPHMLREMVNILQYLISYDKKGSHMRTMENVMKLCQMIVQGQWEKPSFLLQLPYITEDILKHFVIKGTQIKTIRQLLSLSEEELRRIFKMFTKEQIMRIMNVAKNMPYVQITTECEVLDDCKTDSYVTGDVITATIKLTRSKLIDNVTKTEINESLERKKIIYQPKEKHKKGSKGRRVKTKKPTQKTKNNKTDEEEINLECEKSVMDDMEEEEAIFQDPKWNELTKSKQMRENMSHTVHCPYFPYRKQEYWWVYITDAKLSKLLTSVQFVTGLMDSDTIMLQFIAPDEPGPFKIAVCVRSDSYLGLDRVHKVTLQIIKGSDKTIVEVSNDSDNDTDDSDNKNDVDDDVNTDSDV